MDFIDFFWGFWNGLIAWIVLIVHVFGGWSDLQVFDVARNGNWYVFGFLLGAGSPILGAAGANSRNQSSRTPRRREDRQLG